MPDFVYTTVDDLVKELKNSNQAQRRDAALRLANAIGSASSSGGLDELFRMADGKWRKFFLPYDLDDQLIAVEALANTNDPKAYFKLIEIYEPHSRLIEEEIPSPGVYYGDAPNPPIIAHSITYTYPGARGKLRSDLEYNLRLDDVKKFDSFGPSVSHIPQNQLHDYLRNFFENDRAHMVIQRSILKLAKEFDMPIQPSLNPGLGHFEYSSVNYLMVLQQNSFS